MCSNDRERRGCHAASSARAPWRSQWQSSATASLFPGTDDGVSRADVAFTTLAESLLLRFGGIHFLYTIVDSGTGRELQNKSVHNIAGFGTADGDRPFRPFARPVPFVPRSTIRIEIEELSAGQFFKDGTLFIVLHGYKRLGE